ncbi:MAG TPA: DUF2062 domain-containing protein [Sphingomicrobium sp.]
MKWVRRHIPTQESLQRHRLLKPFAHHLGQPALWHLNRRSVPRGVALGLFVGVIIPVMHTAIASVLAIPTRANIAVAAAFTLVVNPLTIPPMYYAAYRIGSWELHQDTRLVDPAVAERVSGELGRILFWVHEASGPIAIGVLTIAIAAAALGYSIAAILWRWRLRNRWRGRNDAPTEGSAGI